ncbi:MAG: hypothetical protein WCF18_18035 [Chthoniobacteraceae bacterium]
MNEFERRWKLAAAAQRDLGDPTPTAPFGFATRVVARWQGTPAPSLAALWQRLAWRVLGGVAMALAAMLAIDTALSPQDDPLTADVGDTVSEMFWLQE